MRRGIRMIAGIPGTGIGGLFYLLIALWMPIRELYFRIRKKGSLERWRIVKGHILITLWIIMGMWATGEFIGLLLTHLGVINTSSQNILYQNILRVAPLLLTLCTLIVIYLGVHVLRLYVVTMDKKIAVRQRSNHS